MRFTPKNSLQALLTLDITKKSAAVEVGTVTFEAAGEAPAPRGSSVTNWFTDYSN